MFRIDDPSASATLPSPEAAGTGGYFTEGVPGSIAATLVRASFLNMLQEENMSLLAAAGITPSKTTYNQVLTAIRRLQQKTTVLTDTGTANAYIAANSLALVVGDLVTGLIQRVSILTTNVGSSTYAPDGLTAKPILGLGLVALQGGELPAKGVATLMYVVASNVNGGNGAWILIECTGAPQQVANATQSQHALPLGQADSRYALATGVASIQGAFKNLVAKANGTNASVVVTADEVALEGPVGTYKTVRSVNLTLNMAGTVGAPNSPSSTVATNTGYFVWLWDNGTTQCLTADLSATAPTAPSGGYIAKALVSWLLTDSTANKFPFGYTQYGRDVSCLVASGSNQTTLRTLGAFSNTTLAPTSIAAYVPVAITSKVRMNYAATANNAALVAPNGSWSSAINSPTAQTTNAATGAVTTSTGSSDIYLESSSIYVAVTGGTGNFWLAGYSFNF